MMVPVKNILDAINHNFTHMEAQFGLAKKSMGIRPDLDAAFKHASEVNLAIYTLAQLEAQARESYGCALPLDLVQKVNARQVELFALANEIAACRQVIMIAESAATKPKFGKFGTN